MEKKYNPEDYSPTPPPYSVAKDMEQDNPTKGGGMEGEQGYIYPHGYSNVPTQPQYNIYPPSGGPMGDGSQMKYPPQQQQQQQPQANYVITSQPTAYNEVTVGGAIDAIKPPTYMCFSIFVCLCCSCLFGLIAITFSCRSDSAYNAGHIENARMYGQRAKMFAIVGIVISLLFSLIYFLLSWFGYIGTTIPYI